MRRKRPPSWFAEKWKAAVLCRRRGRRGRRPSRLAMYPNLILFFALFSGLGCAGRLFYFPDRNVYRLPSQAGLDYEEVRFTARDGTRLHGWFIPAEGEAIGTVVHFHGNAQNMTAHFSFVAWLPAEGFNLLTFDYRGYGGSDRKEPTRRGLFKDGVAALDYIRHRDDTDPNRVVVLGQSLGGAVALSVVGRKHPDGVRAVAVDSSFYSYQSMVRDKIALLPVLRWFRWPLSLVVVGNSYSPGRSADDISPIPLLVLHGTEDTVVPYRHGEKLFTKAREPKEFIAVERGRHTEALVLPDDTYRRQLVAFFKAALGPAF